MKSHPMLFQGDLVNAINAGRKTQTRRFVMTREAEKIRQAIAAGEFPALDSFDKFPEAYQQWLRDNVAPMKVGDEIWVRETWAGVNHYGVEAVAYRADGEVIDLCDIPALTQKGHVDPADPRLEKVNFANWAADLIGGVEGRWVPSIHMPRWASRTTLVVTGVEFQGLLDITAADALAEGIEHKTMNCPRHEFFQLWNSIYGDMSHLENPMVWRYTFKVK
ncbi:TPA: hypothetical protein ACGQ50_000773 [Enterobacter cloacae]